MSFSGEASGSVSFSVQIREWFVLEVTDSTAILKSEGPSGASVASNVDLSGAPVQIRAFMSVAKNQTVQLRAQALGDLVNSRGDVLPASDIGWEASGEGFQAGVLNKNQSGIMAQWMGPGFRQGSISYRFLKDKGPKNGYTQKIVYSLAAI